MGAIIRLTLMLRVQNKKQVAKRLAIAVVLIVFGMVSGGVLTVVIYKNSLNTKQERYNLLADRILSTNGNERIVNFTDLRQKLTDYTDANLQNIDYSIYYEYLPTGTSVGLNETHTLIGASLLKVPFAMQYYHALEEGTLKKDDIITLTQANLDSTYGSLYKKGSGYKLTLDDLVTTMLRDSDNTALRALADVLSQKVGLQTIDQVFNFVDLSYASDKEGSTLIGAEAYSSILKCLYFACYISKEHSQEVLYTLTNTTFNDRLKRYIPQDTMPTIAHKIGSFEQSTQSDCGIFYVPTRPYLLCVMINGSDEFASQHIGKISVIVYEHMTQNLE